MHCSCSSQLMAGFILLSLLAGTASAQQSPKVPDDVELKHFNLFSALLVFNYFDLRPQMESSGYTERPQGVAEGGSLLSRLKHGGARYAARVTAPKHAGSLRSRSARSNEGASTWGSLAGTTLRSRRPA